MKKSKWICRYIFLGILLALSLAWTIYCAVILGQLNDTKNSLQYIDWAVSGSSKAVELLDRIAQFEGLSQTSIILTCVIVVCLISMIVFHIVSEKVRKKKAAAPVKAAKIPKSQKVKNTLKKSDSVPPVNVPVAEKSVSKAEEKKSGFCSNCGKFYNELPDFCSECGEKIDKN